MKKKFIFLIVVMIFAIQLCSIIIPTSAATGSTATFEVSTERVFAGEAVYVPITLTSNPGLTYVKLKVSYDTHALTLFGVQNGNIISDLTRGNAYVWSAASNTRSTGTFATLIFSVSTTAAAGEYPITVTCVEASNHDTDVAVSIQKGSIIVNAEECIHDMKSVSYKAPTCQKTGSRVMKCTKCGYSETVTFEKIDCVAEYEAGCTNDAVCEYCGKVLKSAYGHKYRTQVIDPTVTDEGYTLHTCMRCGDSYKTDVRPPIDDFIPVTGIKIDKSAVTIKLGETDYTVINATVKPSNATNQKIIWTSSNEAVVRVSAFASTPAAKIYAKSAGTAIITATTEDGAYVATCVVTVTDEPKHTLIHVSYKASTVTEDGNIEYWYCSKCGWMETVGGIETNKNAVIIPATGQPDIDEKYPAIVISNVNGSAGSLVTVTVSVRNNPGFNTLNFGVVFNRDILTLTESKNLVNSLTMTEGASYVFDGAANYGVSGDIMKLTFKISEGVSKGEYPLKLVFLNAGNENFQEIQMAAVSGTLTVINTMHGDANGDGKVTLVDLSMLRKHFASIDPETGIPSLAVKGGADANGDGNITMVDLSMLRKYFASIDPETGEPTLVLDPRK